MVSGRSVFQRIQNRVDAARREVDDTGDRLHKLRQQSERWRNDEARALGRLAKVRLGELEGSRVAARLDAADREALALLEDRERELDRLGAAITAGAGSLVELMTERSERLAERDTAAAAFHELVAATRERLTGVQEYRAQQGRVQFAAAQANNADAKAQLSEQDRETKRKPYEDDKLFDYLWQRRYRFPAYRAWPLFATLDGWVARLCDYDQAHRDYGLLLEIPKRLREHADGLVATAERENTQLVAMETEALTEDGAPALQAVWDETQQRLDECEARVMAAETAQDRLCLEQNALNAGNDPFSARAAELIEAQLGAEDIRTLRRDALETASGADDAIVREIAALRKQLVGLTPLLEEAQRAYAKANEAFEDLATIERKFRRRDFEADNSVFDSDFDVGRLLGNLLNGVMHHGDVWSTMRRSQRWESTSSGGFGGFGGFGSSGSSGGFGGFGGGGFSSGGGFGGGGGGGFSTGGGF